MTATVIITTTGTPELKKCIESVLNQTYKTQVYLVIDGPEISQNVFGVIDKSIVDQINFSVLPINVGAGGFYGHRIYAAFTHLVNTDYILYLDGDCWFDPEHVQQCVDIIENNDLDWSYSLRKIVSKDGNFVCNDDCESLGIWNPYTQYNFVDTNCYCIKTSVASSVSSAWNGGWGQDRIFFNTLFHWFKKVDCTGNYTVNYRLGGNDGSVKSEFFIYGNKYVKEKYNGEFPWQKS